MKISKTHQRFSERLHNHRVLTNPEEFLGPNYKAVLNFWLSIDDLSKDQWEVIVGRYRNFYDYHWSEWCKAVDEAWDASREAIRDEFAINSACAVWGVYYGFSGAYYATRELIGMHLILEQNKPLKFFPMFLNL